MIFLSEDALIYMKKLYIKNCIYMFLIGAGMCAIVNKMSERKNKINNLTKKVEELKLKGD